MADERQKVDYRKWMFEILELYKRLDALKKDFEKIHKEIHPEENSAEKQAAEQLQTNIAILQNRIFGDWYHLNNKLNGKD